MLSIRELRDLGRRLDAAAFREQLGPFAIVQRPLEDAVRGEALELGSNRTRAVDRSGPQVSSLLFDFDELMVATLPPVENGEALSIGRQPDCDLVIEDASVSKRHAIIRWLPTDGRATIEDAGSSNGTLLNGSELHRATPLKDGDEITIGDARFVFLLMETLHRKLTAGMTKPYGLAP